MRQGHVAGPEVIQRPQDPQIGGNSVTGLDPDEASDFLVSEGVRDA